MKGLLNKLKTFFLKHGEKFVFGIFCMASLWVLMGTHWVPFQKTPDELEVLVDKSNNNIESSTWPEEEKIALEQKFKDDIVPKAENIIDKKILADVYVFKRPIFSPPTGDDDPNKEPIYSTVDQLLVSSGNVVLAQNKIVDDLAEDAQKDLEESEEKKKEEKDSNPFAPTNPTGPGGIDGDPGEFPGGEFPGGPPAFEEFPGGDPRMEGGPDGSTAGIPSNLQAYSTPFVSIRGIINREQQIANIADAMNLTAVEAEGYLQYLEFNLERQGAVAGEDPWAGEWEQVDIQNSLDILAKSPSFSEDPVSLLVQDPSLSLLLPPRILGNWTSDLVSHPKLENFELSPQEMKREVELNLENARKRIEAESKVESNVIQRRGLNRLQVKTNTRDELTKSSVTDIMKTLKETMDTPKDLAPAKALELRKKIAEQIKLRASVAGKLTLFRYIDFDVEPGRAYRYRVRLVLYNPNYGLPVERAESQSVVEGEERVTEWSQPSGVALIEPQTKVFVTKVDPPNRDYDELRPSLQVYMLHKETGTPVHTDRLKITQGDYIVGKANAYLANPSEMTYESESVQFESDMMLIDSKPFHRFDPEFHKDLNLSRGSNLRINPKTLGLTSEIIVQDQYGRLIVKDNISEYYELKDAEKTQKQLDDAFADYKDRKKKAAMAPDPSDPLLEGSEAEMMEAEMGLQQFSGKNNNKKSRGLLRRR